MCLRVVLIGLVCLLGCECEVFQNEGDEEVLIPTAPTIDLKDISNDRGFMYVLAAREPLPYTVMVKLSVEIYRGSSRSSDVISVRVRREHGYYISGMGTKEDFRAENIKKVVLRIEKQLWCVGI